MRDYIILLITLLFFGSCAKVEEVVLTSENTKIVKEYFPVNKIETTYYELASLPYPDEERFEISRSNDYSVFNNYGSFRLYRSYFYPYQSSFAGYRESVEVKNNNDIVTFRISEVHERILFNYYSTDQYTPVISAYELQLLKPNLQLNDSWITSEDVLIEYETYNGNTPPIADLFKNVTFNYLVTEIDGSRMIAGANYQNLITIRVNYSIEAGMQTTRTYTFSEQIGLITFSIGEYVFVKS